MQSESQKERDLEKHQCDYTAMHEKHNELLKSMKEYQEINKESSLAAKKEYRNTNKDEIAVAMKGYRDTNKDAIATVKKGYREAKKDETEIANKEYYTSNKVSILDKRKISYATELHPFFVEAWFRTPLC